MGWATDTVRVQLRAQGAGTGSRSRMGLRLVRVYLLRLLGGSGAVALLMLPQVVMPHAWIADSGLSRFGLWRVVASALVSLLLVPVLRLVSYRRRDWLVLAFVPGWQYVLAWRIGYRAALLPLRDWTPRPDERLRARRLRRGQLWVLLPDDDQPAADPSTIASFDPGAIASLDPSAIVALDPNPVVSVDPSPAVSLDPAQPVGVTVPGEAAASTAVAEPVTGADVTTRQVTWRSPLAQPSLRG